MAAQGTLTLNTKAYTPRGKTGDVATWQLVGDSTFGGAISTVSESLRGPSRDGVYRGRLKLEVPLAASADSACGCTGSIKGTGIFDANIVIPLVFSTAERADFCDRLQALIANAITTAMVDSLEGSW